MTPARPWRVHAFVVLLTCTLTLQADPPQASRQVRVMTWNIAAGHGNLPAIAQVIRDAAPDVAALQEVDVHWHERSHLENQASRLAEMLAMQVRFAPIYRLPGAPGQPAREFGLAILSRHPIVTFRNHELSRLSTQTPGATEPESLPGFPEAVIALDPVRLRVFTTHLDYRPDSRVRIQQVAETTKIVGEGNGPVVLMGDLNAPPAAAELAPLFRLLTDAWPATRDSGLTYPADAPIRRIDYILVSKRVTVRDIQVLAVTSSDHRPVVAELDVY
jgi:endonuclease/exonuclease/phosphatase family metal-dependent hydrolase